MVAELAIERIELLPRGRTDREREREVGRLAARAHLERRRVEVRRVALHDVDDGLREARLPPAEHLDREIGRVGEERRRFRVGHASSALRARLVVLEELKHAGVDGTRLARADGAAVDLGDRQDLARRRRDPDLVGGGGLRGRDPTHLGGYFRLPRELEHEIVGDAGQDQVVLGRRRDHAILHQKDVAARSLGDPPVADEQRLGGAGVLGLLAQQAVGEERHRLDVAAAPAVVLARHHRHALRALLCGRRSEGVGNQQHGRRDRGLGELVRPRRDAACHLEVDALVLPRVPVDQAPQERSPRRVVVRVREPDRFEAVRKPREVLLQPEERAAIHGDHLVHAVAEDETPVEDRHARLRERQELAVQIADLRHGFASPYFLNHSRRLSQVRPKKPATGTVSRATSGYSPSGLPSRTTRTTPTFWPALTGASSGCSLTSSALTFSDSPRGRTRSTSASKPALSVCAVPFQTGSVLTAWPFSYSRTLSKNWKP